MKKAIAILAMVFSAQAFAGAGNALLTCKSADGKVKVSGDVPGDFAEFGLKVEVAGKNGTLTVDLYSRLNQTTLQTEENGRIAIVDALENGVYTIKADDKEGMQSIRLYALPKSVKYQSGGRNYHASFIGNVDVSSENGGATKTVACTLDYAI